MFDYATHSFRRELVVIIVSGVTQMKIGSS